MNSTADAVCVNGLTQIYRHSYWRKSEVRALNGIDLCVRQGDMFGLVGPNGAGKTTLLKILTGAVRATNWNPSSVSRTGEVGLVAFGRRGTFIIRRPAITAM